MRLNVDTSSKPERISGPQRLRGYDCHCGYKAAMPPINSHCMVCRCDEHIIDSCGPRCYPCRIGRVK